MSAEDDTADTIRPRLEAAGADLRQIEVVDAVAPDQFESNIRMFDLVRDLTALECKIRTLTNCRLVIIDPVTAFCGTIDSHKNADVRGMLASLSDFARRLGVAVVCVTHLNKNSATPAAYRTMGSLAFTAASRVALIVTKDPHDEAKRLMVMLKNNLAQDSLGLGYRLDPAPDNPSTAVVRWDPDPLRITVDDVLLPPKSKTPSARDEAAQWLRALLCGGPVPVARIRKEGNEAGHSWPTIRRAKVLVGAEAIKTGFEDGWHWMIPAAIACDPRCSDIAKSNKLSTFAETERLRSCGAENEAAIGGLGILQSQGAQLKQNGHSSLGNTSFSEVNGAGTSQDGWRYEP